MTTGYCVTCNRGFPIETRIAGKLLSMTATTLVGTSRKVPWWVTLLLGVGSVWLGHEIDKGLMQICPTPGCKTVLKIVDHHVPSRSRRSAYKTSSTTSLMPRLPCLRIHSQTSAVAESRGVRSTTRVASYSEGRNPRL